MGRRRKEDTLEKVEISELEPIPMNANRTNGSGDILEEALFECQMKKNEIEELERGIRELKAKLEMK